MTGAMRCRRATRLLSDRLDGPLPAGPRLWLAGHLLMCEPCREAERQLAFLHLAFGRMDEIVAREGLPFDPSA